MGADIHLHFERKNKDNVWEVIEIDERLIPDDRYYDLFGFLADVRGNLEIKSGWQGRGIPEDSTFNEFYRDKYSEWHSGTYFYLDEFENAPWKDAGLDDCYFYIFFIYVFSKLIFTWGSGSKDEKRNVRICMAFDN